LGTWQAIFKNAKALAQDYIPKQLFFREKEFREISQIFSAAEVGLYLHTILAGPPGSGKTVTVLKAREDAGGKGCYAAAGKSGYETLIKLALSLGLNVPPLGFSFDHLWRLVKARLPKVVIIDEADKMMGRGGNDLLYELTRTDLSLILITNTFNFYERYVFDVRVRSTFKPKTLFFSRYGFDELLRILQNRAEEAFQPGAVEEEAVSYCAALASREGGDARYGIELLKRGGEIAASSGQTTITKEHIDAAREQVEGDELMKSLSTMKSAEQALLYIIAKRGEEGISPSELYREYMKAPNAIPSLSIRTIREYVRGLELQGFIKLEASGMGRGKGISWKITLTCDRQIVLSVLGKLFEAH